MSLAAILQLVVFILLFAEIIIPSGGILFLLSLGMLVWSWIEIVALDSQNHLLGFALLDLIGIPLLLWYAIKYLEKSHFSLQSELTDDEGYQVRADWSAEEEGNLHGEYGTVTQDLRPVGKIVIKGTEYEALSQNDWIESGKIVQVISTQENKIIVTISDRTYNSNTDTNSNKHGASQ